MVIIDQVTKRFVKKTGSQLFVKKAVEGVSFHIPKGEVVGLIGVSGAGKTSLLKLICGLLLPDTGLVRVNRKDPIVTKKQKSKEMGVLFADSSGLIVEETVETNIELIRSIYRLRPERFFQDKEMLCECFGIGDILKTQVNELSLGQKRRVELMRLLLPRPKLIMMDEPCIGLDAEAKWNFELSVKRLEEEGTTIILSSHSMEDIESLCSRIILINEGKIIYNGNTTGLYKRYSPMNEMTVVFRDSIPDMEDLPVEKYTLGNQTITISYNTNHISAAEISQVLLKSTKIHEINIRKPALGDVIAASVRKEGDGNE